MIFILKAPNVFNGHPCISILNENSINNTISQWRFLRLYMVTIWFRSLIISSHTYYKYNSLAKQINRRRKKTLFLWSSSLSYTGRVEKDHLSRLLILCRLCTRHVVFFETTTFSADTFHETIGTGKWSLKHLMAPSKKCCWQRAPQSLILETREFKS